MDWSIYTRKAYCTECVILFFPFYHINHVIQDLKADNILVEMTGVCKISDFGISKRTEDLHGGAFTAMQGTVFWMAPEVITTKNGGYNNKIDIWSVGCVVLEMWAGMRPWNGEEMLAVMFKLHQSKQPPPIPEDVILTEEADDFRRKCFAVSVCCYLFDCFFLLNSDHYQKPRRKTHCCRAPKAPISGAPAQLGVHRIHMRTSLVQLMTFSIYLLIFPSAISVHFQLPQYHPFFKFIPLYDTCAAINPPSPHHPHSTTAVRHFVLFFLANPSGVCKFNEFQFACVMDAYGVPNFGEPGFSKSLKPGCVHQLCKCCMNSYQQS